MTASERGRDDREGRNESTKEGGWRERGRCHSSSTQTTHGVKNAGRNLAREKASKQRVTKEVRKKERKEEERERPSCVCVLQMNK